MGISVPDVTIVGAGSDRVLIGPETYQPQRFGIVLYYQTATGVSISGLTLRNLRIGIIPEANASLRELRLVGCHRAVYSASGGSVIEACDFDSNGIGVAGLAGSYNIQVVQCHFWDHSEYACNFTWSASPMIVDCLIERGLVGISASGVGTKLGLQSVVVRETSSVGVGVMGNAELRMFDSEISVVTGEAMYIGGADYVEMRRNHVSGGSYGTLEFQGQRAPMLIRNNDFQKGSGYLTIAYDLLPTFGTTFVDLSGNFWNTTDADSLATWTMDGYDDPNNDSRVIYEPFLTEYVGIMKDSIGGLKALFGGGHD